MKLSNYNIETSIDSRNIIYNTLTRKYFLYNSLEKDYIDSVLNTLNRDKYEVNDSNIIKKLIQCGIIVDDSLNELEQINYKINKSKFQNNTFIIVIVPTLECNFGCTYCYEERRNLQMTDEVIENLIKFIEEKAKEVKNLRVSWFGGEPMLEYGKIKMLTEKFKGICEKEKCNYSASMTTNGYLISDDILEEFEKLDIKQVQITIDGDREFHNQKRPLKNGKGTFDTILSNFNKLLNKDIQINLRINFDEHNKKSIGQLLEKIPEQKRKNISICIMNLFQNKEKINQYELYKMAIDKGYKYNYVRNKYAICEANFDNSLMMHPNGQVTVCQNFAESGMYFGKISDKGKVLFKNSSNYIKFRTVTPMNNEKCRECNILPMCMGGCPYKRFKDNDNCYNRKFDGMTVEDMIKLHVYYETKNNNLRDVSNI